MQKTPGLSRTLAKVIQRHRRQKRLTQEKLAEAADIDQTYVSQVELGKRNLSVDVADRLARAFGMKLSALIEEAEREAKK